MTADEQAHVEEIRRLLEFMAQPLHRDVLPRCYAHVPGEIEFLLGLVERLEARALASAIAEDEGPCRGPELSGVEVCRGPEEDACRRARVRHRAA